MSLETNTKSGKAKGGIARANKLTSEQRREISQKGVAAKKELLNIPKATHGSVDRPLVIGSVEIPCYVLDNEARVLSQRGLMAGLGMTKGSTSSGDDQLTVLANNLLSKSLINNELAVVMKTPIKFRAPHGGRPASGYPATILADLCEAILAARAAGKLDSRQSNLAKQCEILVRGFARVGIIALVDEATGFQLDRKRGALAHILEAFIAKELQPYVSTFSVEYYQELFRLRGLDFNKDIIKKPQYFGHLTNDIVYKRLAPGVLEELKKVTPKNQSGKSKAKLFQSLTANIGYPKLREHLGKVVAIMQLSETYLDFKQKLDRLVPKLSNQGSFEFDDEKDSGKGL